MPRRISVLAIYSLLCMAMPTAALAWGNYSINGDSIAPIEVFDNGEKTFFRLAASEDAALPVILSFSASGKAVEKYSQRDGCLVVNRIASRFELVFGDRRATVINKSLPEYVVGPMSEQVVSNHAYDKQSSGAVETKQGVKAVEEHAPSQANQEPKLSSMQAAVSKRSANPDAGDQTAAKTALQLPAVSPAVPTNPQEIARGYSIPQGSFRDAFAAVAKHYGLDLVWDAQKPAEEDRFDRPIKIDGIGLEEDLTKLEALLNKGRTITNIDAYHGNNVLYVRSL